MADVRRDTPVSPHFERGHYAGIMAALLQRSNEEGAGVPRCQSSRVPEQTERDAGFVRNGAPRGTHFAPQLGARDLHHCPSLPGKLSHLLVLSPGSAQVTGMARTLSGAALAGTNGAGRWPMPPGLHEPATLQPTRFPAVSNRRSRHARERETVADKGASLETLTRGSQRTIPACGNMSTSPEAASQYPFFRLFRPALCLVTDFRHLSTLM